jgi:hypothetical protein
MHVGAEGLGGDPFPQQPADALALVEDADEERDTGDPGQAQRIAKALAPVLVHRREAGGVDAVRDVPDALGAEPFLGEFGLQVPLMAT